MQKKLKFQFEKGGEIVAEILPDVAPETIASVISVMMLRSTCYHTRWCGREMYIPFTSNSFVSRENQTSSVNTGDVTFWREWDKDTSDGVLSIFYGAETVRYHTGYLQVNVFARVSQDQWKTIQEIGERIWKQGIESIQANIC